MAGFEIIADISQDKKDLRIGLVGIEKNPGPD